MPQYFNHERRVYESVDYESLLIYFISSFLVNEFILPPSENFNLRVISIKYDIYIYILLLG